MPHDQTVVIYASIVAFTCLVYVMLRLRTDSRARAAREASIAAGLTEPASLHPVIDPIKCLGCGACLRVCPEGDILGLINGRAELVEPANCIGHGACKDSCPRDAITLVFGTATRGIDLPTVGPDFQTNVPGIYIAGELGGMGLIRNAIEQGRQALGEIAKKKRPTPPGVLDVVIIGGGPAGFSASLAAIEQGLKFVTLEQDSFGGTVSHFPRGKLVMTAPATLPLVGTMKFREIKKEALLEFWTNAAKSAGLQIKYQERVESIQPADFGFVVRTAAGAYAARSVLLAIGRRGTPRSLGVPGEDQSKVVYRLIDPEQYGDQHVLVVGGGDSALEAAASIAEVSSQPVILSYRSAAFSRSKPKNRARVEAAEKAGKLKVMLSSEVKHIGQDDVTLAWKGKTIRRRNDAVIVCAGGIVPTTFLKSIGIDIETKYGTA